MYSIVLHAYLPKVCLADQDVKDEKLMYVRNTRGGIDDGTLTGTWRIAWMRGSGFTDA